MKNFLVALIAILCMTPTANGALVMTGVIDGPLSGGAPKAVEFYATADIADLSIYGIELVSNAGSSAGIVETPFSGSILAGQYYYIATEAVEFENVFGFAPNVVTGDANHNGDDDFYLYENGVVIDTWGGSDGVDNSGTVSDLLDSWAYRNNNTGPSVVFDASEWTIAPINSLDGLDAAGVAAATPFGTFTSITAIPEPSSFAFIGLIGAGVVIRKRRRRNG